jgi:hypothetical protein
MSVEALLKLRDDVGKVLSQKAGQLEQQLSKLGREAGWTARPRKRDEGQEGAYQISRQRGQHLGRPRSAARMAAREAQGWRQARRLCRSKDRGFSQSLPEESKEAAKEVSLAMLAASSIASIMPSHRRGGAL